MNWQKFGEVDCLTQIQSTDNPTIVLMHGLGADAHDLAGLANYLNIENVNWVFPNGPLQIDIGFGMVGRSWFDIDMPKLQECLMKKDAKAYFESETAASYTKGAATAERMLFDIKRVFSNVTVGGFSQGAMMATDCFLQDPSSFNNLLILSGILATPTRWSDFAAKSSFKPGQKVFQSHGSADPVLPYELAVSLKDFIEGISGLSHQFESFGGGHEIPPNVLEKLKTFITESM
jgi:phospholipase/carboxylesterase